MTYEYSRKHAGDRTRAEVGRPALIVTSARGFWGSSSDSLVEQGRLSFLFMQKALRKSWRANTTCGKSGEKYAAFDRV